MQRSITAKGVGSLSSVAMFLLSTAADAAESNAGILDNVLAKYKAVASTWSSIMVTDAMWLFWGLMLISMVWTFGLMALKGGGLQEALAEAIRYFAAGGFFLYVLTNGPAISVSIIDTLRQIAANATGNAQSLTPSSIVDIGFDIFYKVLDQSSVWSPVDSTAGIAMGLIVLGILALVGVNMLLLLVSSWILCYGGIFFLGFGGGRWTTDIAINFYKQVLAIGVQLMAMTLIIGVGQSFIDQYYNAMSAGISLKDMAVLFVACLVLLALTDKIPPMLASVVSGGMGGGSGIGSFGAGALMGAAATAAAAAASGGALALAGASQMAGGASALKAAFQSAQEHMAEGSGMFGGGSGGSEGGSGDLGGSGGDSGGSPSGSGGGSGDATGNGKSGSAFAQAMGTAGRFAADMGANLAKGTGSLAKDKALSMSDAARERIGQTVGGRIASEISSHGAIAQARQDRNDIATAASIQAGEAGQQAREYIAEKTGPSSNSNESFEGDGVGASENEEVAAFVNKQA